MDFNQEGFKQPLLIRIKLLLSQIRNSSNKKGILILLLLIAILPLALILATNKSIRNFLYRSQAAPNATLSLAPQGVSQNGQGRWQFTLNQDVNVNVVVQTGDLQVQIGEVVINYNPTKLSAQSVTCNPGSALQYSLTSNDPSVQVIKRDGSNNETGRIEIACVSFNPPFPTNHPQFDPNWQLPVQIPILTNTTATLATVVFRPVSLSTNNTDLQIDFTSASPGNLNDSNLIPPLSPPAVTTPGMDILAGVTNATYDVVSTPLASPTPARHGEGDANNDNAVDIQDFQIWRNEFLSATTSQADFNGDSASDIQDFQIWRNTFLAGG